MISSSLRFLSSIQKSRPAVLVWAADTTSVRAARSITTTFASMQPQSATPTTTKKATSPTKHNNKELIIVRHGQAQHNPRAEVAKAKGCSMEEFIALMREDDVLDAVLTEDGRLQAQAARLSSEWAASIQLVVSSSLSRALETADHVHPPLSVSSTSWPLPKHNVRRVSHEHFREVSGDLLNCKRRTKSELAASFPHWDLTELVDEEDALWTPIMEDLGAAAERGYLGLKWLMEDCPEEKILLVSHGGILRYTMNDHPLVRLRDGRSQPHTGKPVEARFDNCEMRRYRLSWDEDEDDKKDNDEAGDKVRRPIVLTQIDETMDSPSTEL